MKMKKQSIATLAATSLFGVFCAFCCGSGGNSSDDDKNGTHENEDKTVSAPTELGYEFSRSEVKLFWSAATNATFYQLKVDNKLYTTASAYYTLTDISRYSAEYAYPWKVRAARKLTADTVYSAWATSTFSLQSTVSPPIKDLPRKFKGIWRTDSASVDVDMGLISLPVDSLIPDNVDVSLLKIEIVEDESNENNAFLSIAGLNDFLPIEDQNLNKITMTPNSKTGGLSGSLDLGANSTVTHDFDPPLPLSDLGSDILDIISKIPMIPDDITLHSLTLTFNRIAISGKLENEEATKAQYEVKVYATIAVDTDNELANSAINMLSREINVILKAYCTKQESD
jgi:hypothetical protein